MLVFFEEKKRLSEGCPKKRLDIKTKKRGQHECCPQRMNGPAVRKAEKPFRTVRFLPGAIIHEWIYF